MWGADSPRNRKPMLWEDYMPYENETDDISKYTGKLRTLPETVQINEVNRTVSYPVTINQDIENYYRNLLKIRKDYKDLFKEGRFRILEVYNDPKTKARIDSETAQAPNIDFISYEIFNKKNSIIVVINNSGDSYPLSLQVPKLFGFYTNQLNKKQKYSISDKKIKIIVKPYEVKILHSKDTNILDSFK